MRGEAAPPTVVLSGYLRKPDFKRIEQLDLTSRIGRVAHGANEKAYASARWFSLSSDGFMHYGKSEKTVNRGGKGRKGYIKVHTSLFIEDSKMHDAPELAFDIVCPARVYTLVAPDAEKKKLWIAQLDALCGCAYSTPEEREAAMHPAVAGDSPTATDRGGGGITALRRATIRIGFTMKHHAKVVKHGAQEADAAHKRRASALKSALTITTKETGGGKQRSSTSTLTSAHEDSETDSDADVNSDAGDDGGDEDTGSRRGSASSATSGGLKSPTIAAEAAAAALFPGDAESGVASGGKVNAERPMSDKFDADGLSALGIGSPSMRSLRRASGGSSSDDGGSEDRGGSQSPRGPPPPRTARRGSKEGEPRRKSSGTSDASSDSDSSLPEATSSSSRQSPKTSGRGRKQGGKRRTSLIASPASLGKLFGVKKEAAVVSSFTGNYAFDNASNTSSKGLELQLPPGAPVSISPTNRALPPPPPGSFSRSPLPSPTSSRASTALDRTVNALSHGLDRQDGSNAALAADVLRAVGRQAERELATRSSLAASQAIAKTVVAFRIAMQEASDRAAAAAAVAAAETAASVAAAADRRSSFADADADADAGVSGGGGGGSGSSVAVAEVPARSHFGSWRPTCWGEGLAMVKWEVVSYEACFGTDKGESPYCVEVLCELLLDKHARPALAEWLQSEKRELNTIAKRLTTMMRGPFAASRGSAFKAWFVVLKLYAEHAISLKLTDAQDFAITAYEALMFMRTNSIAMGDVAGSSAAFSGGGGGGGDVAATDGGTIAFALSKADLEPIVECALDLCVPPSRQLWRSRCIAQEAAERAAAAAAAPADSGSASASGESSVLLGPENVDAFGKHLVHVGVIGALLRVTHPLSTATVGLEALRGWELGVYAVKTLSMLLIHAKSASNIATILGATEGDSFLRWIWPYFTSVAQDRKIRESSAGSKRGGGAASGALSPHGVSSADAAQIYTLSTNAIGAVIDYIVGAHSEGVGAYMRAMAQSLARFGGWGRSATAVYRTIINSVFSKLSGSCKTWRFDFSDGHWIGVVQLFEAVLDFVFSTPNDMKTMELEAKYAEAVVRYNAMPVPALVKCVVEDGEGGGARTDGAGAPSAAPPLPPRRPSATSPGLGGSGDSGGAAAPAAAAAAAEDIDVNFEMPMNPSNALKFESCTVHFDVNGRCADMNLVKNALKLVNAKLSFEGEATETSKLNAQEKAIVKRITTVLDVLTRAKELLESIESVPFNPNRDCLAERAAMATAKARDVGFVTRAKARRSMLCSGIAAQPPAALWRVLRGSSDDVDKSSAGLTDASALKYNSRTAAGLHQMWCESRKHMPDGTFEPRIKTIDGVTMDIANMHFDDLPPSLQTSNMEAAKCACRNVEREFAAGRDINLASFLEEASELQHENWIEHNRSWADPHQLVPYTDLSHEDKEKDRAIVRVAIKEYDRFMADLYQKIIIAASQSNILTSAVGTMFRKFRRASSFGPMSGLSAVAAALQEEEKAEDIDTAAFATELAKIIESLRKTGALSNEAGMLELNPATIVSLWENREAANLLAKDKPKPKATLKPASSPSPSKSPTRGRVSAVGL